MDTEAFNKVIEEMREFIETCVRVGFYSREQILDVALDVYSDEFIPALLRPKVEQIVGQAIIN